MKNNPTVIKHSERNTHYIRRTHIHSVELQAIISYVNDALSLAIETGSKRTEDTLGRALYYKIAKKLIKASHEEIACHVDRDHSTVTHAVKSTIPEIDKDPVFMKLFAIYVNDYNNKLIDSKVGFSLCEALRAIELLKEEVFKLKEEAIELIGKPVVTIEELGLTDNEVVYRGLNSSQKAIYDERVSLILKSFEWKKSNSEIEKIYCSS